MMKTSKLDMYGRTKTKIEKINWSEKHQLIHRLLASVSIQDFIALSKLSDDYYFRMIASDLQHKGRPSVNLQRVYKDLKTSAPIEKTDGCWTLHSNGQWICGRPNE